jgi:F-box/WD-40 domain protein MET30
MAADPTTTATTTTTTITTLHNSAGDIWNHDSHETLRNRYRRDIDAQDQNISTPAISKHAEQTVMPFLTQHIPSAYNPPGNEGTATNTAKQSSRKITSNTKFCYRHQPDLKCRRPANEPTMDSLQSELASLSQSDQQAISHVWSLFSAAPGKHRNLMLQGILTQCCFPQLSFIAANVRDLIKIDFLSALPDELGYQVLCHLDTTSLCKAAQVSRRWRSLADDDVVWHRMCEQHIDRKCTKCGWGLPLLERKRLRTEKRQIQLRAEGREDNHWSPEIAPIHEEHVDTPMLPLDPDSDHSSHGRKRSADVEMLPPPGAKRRCSAADATAGDMQVAQRKRPWKDIYKDRFKVGTAWKYGRCSTRLFKGHTNGVMCVQFDDNVLLSGSYDATVKVWDIHTGEELRTLKGHTSGIRCLQFDESGKLMTGSLDSTIRLWNWRTGETLRVFQAHGDGVITLHYTGRYVASGSRDRTIRVWDSKIKETFLLRGHSDWVNSVKVEEDSRTLFSASDDLSVRIWDLDAKQCIRIFDGHVGQVQQVLPMPEVFELEEQHDRRGSEKDDDASSVSSVTLAAAHHHIDTRHQHDHAASQPFWPNDPKRPAPPRYMITGALDSTIRLWDTHFSPSTQSSCSQSGATNARPLDQTAQAGGTQNTTTDTTNNNAAIIPPQILPTDPLTNSHIPRAQACIRTFFGHVEGIWALSADHLRLISGSEDRMLKVWDPRTGKCERTFTGHQGPVTCAWLGDERVASGSEDGDIRVLWFGEEGR